MLRTINGSRPARGEWIEMKLGDQWQWRTASLAPRGASGLKCFKRSKAFRKEAGLAPRGASGLK